MMIEASREEETMQVKAILFDIDGTLVDSNDFHVKAWDEAFQSADYRFDLQLIHDQIGKGTDMLVPTLIPGADEALQEKLGKVHGDIFKEKYLQRVSPFPAAHALLERVKEAGKKVVLASSASKEELDHYVDLLEIRDIVSATTTADDVENTKPAPDIFAMALKKLTSLTPSEAVVVGDTPYDMEAASKCGIPAIGLRSGKFNDDALLAAGAVALYDDVSALLLHYKGSLLNG